MLGPLMNRIRPANYCMQLLPTFWSLERKSKLINEKLEIKKIKLKICYHIEQRPTMSRNIE